MQHTPADSCSYRTVALCAAALLLTLVLAGGQLKGSSHGVHLLKGSSTAPEAAAWGGMSGGAQRAEGLDGFISATSTTSERHGLAMSSRAWRKVGAFCSFWPPLLQLWRRPGGGEAARGG